MSALQTSAAHFFAICGIHTTPGTFALSSCRNDPLGTTTCGAPVNTNTLSWTWPANMLNSFNAGLIWLNLTLQRSTSAYNLPNGTNVIYDNGANVAPIPDAHWADVKQWSSYAAYFADNPNPSVGSYVDPWAVSSPVMYRLISNSAKTGDPVLPPFFEMVWNTALVVPVQKLNASSIPGGTRLNWSAPDVSWFPGNFLQFISYMRCPCGVDACHSLGTQNQLNRIIVNSSSFAAPTPYDVFKSVDGVTWGSPVVTNAFINGCGQWDDSGITTPGGAPWYYKFIAHPPSGPAITSNIIFAN